MIKFVKMTLVGGLTVGLPIWLTGCAGVGRRGTKVEQAVISAGRTSTVTEEELRERLRDFGKRFGLRIEGTALQIGEQTQENRVRLVATYWKLLAIPYCQDAILHPDVRTALVDTWALCIQIQQYFESPSGKEVLGESTALARATCDENLRDIEAIADLVLAPAHREQARAAVYEFAKEHPLDWSYARRSVRPAAARARADSLVGQTLNAVFLPLRSIGNMDQTALAIREVAAVAEDINLTAQQIPSQMRWNIELVLHQINDLETVASTRSNLTALTQTAQDLPLRLRKELSTLLSESDERQFALQTTLQQLQQTVAAVDKTMPALQQTAVRTAEAGKEWTQTVQAFDQMMSRWSKPAGAAPDQQRPFDINEWTRAADSISKAAVELRVSIQEMNKTIADPDGATARVRSLVTHVTLCLIALVVVIFAAVVCARFLEPNKKGCHSETH